MGIVNRKINMILLTLGIITGLTLSVNPNFKVNAQETIKDKTGITKEASEKIIQNETPKPKEPETVNKKEEAPVEEKKIESQTVEKDVSSEDTILLSTEKGPIKIKLFLKEAPGTTANFIDLAKKKFYDGTVFHRVVDGFVIQGGDPLGDGTGNYTDPKTNNPRFINLETNPNLKFDKEGRVGMARTGDPNSASCQFFIALMPLPSLDPGGVDPYGYAVFGQVTEDSFETVKKIVADSKPAFPGSEKPANPVKIHSAVLLSK